MILEKAKIYGVDGVGAKNTTLTRTDSSVGLSYLVGESEINSDFDNCYPWSEMREIMDIEGNVFIKIPKFYSKITKNSDGTYKHQISGVRYSGFTTLFVDGQGNELDYILIGKYEASGSSDKAFSKSGETLLTDITISDMRTACMANGRGYQQYDFLIDAIVRELFTVEFATTDSQSIMRGYTDSRNSAALISGHTDNVKTPSGSANNGHDENCVQCNTDGMHACKYRGIENLWGNVFAWCDGISFSGEKIYVCFDPEKYECEKFDMPYIYVGDRPIDWGYLVSVEYFDKFPLLGYTKKTNHYNNEGYYSDYVSESEDGSVLAFGGCWVVGSDAGLWSWSGGVPSSLFDPAAGGRLCYKPLIERD